MNRIESLSDRAMDIAHIVGGSVKQAIPRAGQLLDAGVKLGAVKHGARVAGSFARRHPALIVATVAASGLLWYAAHRRAKRAENGNDGSDGSGRRAIEGSARRVDAKRGTRRTTTRTSGSRASSTGSRSGGSRAKTPAEE